MDSPLEPCYSVAQVSEAWGLSRDTIREISPMTDAPTMQAFIAQLLLNAANLLQSTVAHTSPLRKIRMKPLLGLFLASCCLTCFGCGRGQLDGDVFIVTQSAENVKLGLVEVRVLPYEKTKNSIAKTKAQAEREVANLQPKLDAAREAVASAERRERAAHVEGDAALDREKIAVARARASLAGGDLSSAKAADLLTTAANIRWKAAIDARDSARDARAPIEEQARSWNSGARYFASLPSPVASVKTDADGKFSIPLHRSATVVLAASATRRLPDKTENYYWLVTVSLDGQPSKRIFLSNDNLTTSDSKDSLVHVVE